MQALIRMRNILLATSAMVLLAACASDGVSGGTGGGGGGGGTTAVPELGVTGTGGVTDALGLTALTDPILGTDGVLGGGGGGQIGGQIPADQLDPLSSQLAPVAEQIANALPLGTVTEQIPGLGVDGTGGLVQDLTGQDLLTPIVGSTGLIGGTLGGGNDGLLGNIIPAGTIPALPGADGLPALPDLSGGGLPALPGLGDAGLPALPGGGTGDSPLAPVTDALDTVTTTLIGATGGATSPLAPVTGVVDTVTSALP